MRKTVVALGMFDGVHFGHRVLLARTAELARALDAEAVALTFSTHPRALFSGSFAVLSASPLKERLIAETGVAVDTVPFTADFAALSPEAFVQWLCDRYANRIAAVVCGYDYRFGKGAAGSGETLQRLGAEYGFATEILPPVYYRDEPCSSTRVRRALMEGDIVSVNTMLTRPYAITGKVVHNRAIGRTLGFPTANVDSGAQLLPKDGVYAGALLLDGRLYAAVTNVGCNPTVDGTERTLETHVLDASLELYGKTVTVLFLQMLREERRFPSKQALTDQIRIDAAAAKKVFQVSEKSVYNRVKVW